MTDPEYKYGQNDWWRMPLIWVMATFAFMAIGALIAPWVMP